MLKDECWDNVSIWRYVDVCGYARCPARHTWKPPAQISKGTALCMQLCGVAMPKRSADSLQAGIANLDMPKQTKTYLAAIVLNDVFVCYCILLQNVV